MNLADSSRKGQVYLYLLIRKGQWVDGPELANEAVGGSEGLKRLRELRSEGEAGGGFRIEARRHPDNFHDIWQYRLVDGPPRKLPPVSAPLGPEPPSYAEYRPLQSTAISPAAPRLGISDFMRKNPDGGFEIIRELPIEPEPEPQIVPTPPQPPFAKYTSEPDHVSFGGTVICPRCHRKGRPMKETGLFRDPFYKGKHPIPCTRCNGFGLVPNSGPIPVQVPSS